MESIHFTTAAKFWRFRGSAQQLYKLGASSTVKNTAVPSLPGSDERIFTLFDVQSLFKQKRKKIFLAAAQGGLVVFAFLLLKAPRYQFEATFKEEAEEKRNAGNVLGDLLGNGANVDRSQAAALMKSYRVLQPLVETLG